MNKICVEKIAKKWNLSPRRIQTYCAEGRITGAEKEGGVWMIPEDAVRPMRISGGKKEIIKKKQINLNYSRQCR